MIETKSIDQDKQEQAVSKIETIKELIFGEHIKAYDSEFENLKKDLLHKREELTSIIEDTRKELSELLDNVSTDINIRITELEDKLADKVDDLEKQKINKKDLGQILIKLGTQISE